MLRMLRLCRVVGAKTSTFRPSCAAAPSATNPAPITGTSMAAPSTSTTLANRHGPTTKKGTAMKFDFHPLANVLPLIEGAEFDAQVRAEIASTGLLAKAAGVGAN